MRNLDGFERAANGQTALETHGVQFIEITKQTPPYILEQLTGKDRVHSFGVQNVSELLDYRLGGSNFDKTCFAITDEQQNPHSVIYIKKDTRPIASERDLHGNVRSILSEKVSPLAQTPSSLIFYSISNISEKAGMGQLLVKQLHAHLTQHFAQATLSTLSPLRTLDKYLQQTEIKNFASYSDEAKRRIGLDYLLTVTDPVQKFHMGNGAFIGDIKLNADNESETGPRMMVNYVYAPSTERLANNSRAFKNREMTGLIAPALLQETGFKVQLQAPSPTFA